MNFEEASRAIHMRRLYKFWTDNSILWIRARYIRGWEFQAFEGFPAMDSPMLKAILALKSMTLLELDLAMVDLSC